MKRISIRAGVSAAAALWLIAIAGCGKKHHAARTQPAPQPAAETSTPERAASPPPANIPKHAIPPAPAKLPTGYVEEGVASWYGIPFHGRAAADGEIYDMETLVAAHRLMPFNTWLKVTNLANDKSVTVRVIDRGPFVDGRIIDLSKAAARAIDMIGPGTARVRLEVIAAPADIPANDFYAVQVGAFSMYTNAERARSDYEQRFGVAQLAVRQGKVQMWRVLVGKETSIPAAQQLAAKLAAENKEVFVVRLDETVIGAGTIAPPPNNVPAPPTAPETQPQEPVPPQ
jgi:peptidoglycan lytic transglycosylase